MISTEKVGVEGIDEEADFFLLEDELGLGAVVEICRLCCNCSSICHS
jgi:hypothetical protein